MTDQSHNRCQPATASELLPCPFCGPGQSMVDPWFDDVSKRWTVGCGRCGASSGRSIHAEGSKEAAIKSWNTRAPAQCGVQTEQEPVAYRWKYEDETSWTLAKNRPDHLRQGQWDVICEPLYLASTVPSADRASPTTSCRFPDCDCALDGSFCEVAKGLAGTSTLRGGDK